MAKFVIPLNQLPPPAQDGTQTLRFRVTTEDKNSISQWSTFFTLESLGQKLPDQVVSNITALTEDGPFEVVWDPNVTTTVNPHGIVDNELQAYDIFVNWNNTSFSYFGRVIGNKVTLYIPDSISATSVRVKGCLPVHPVPTQPLNDFQIFDTGTVSL